MEYTIYDIARLLKTNYNNIREAIKRLYPDLNIKGYIFNEIQAEQIAFEYIKSKYPYLVYLLKENRWQEVFDKAKLYTKNDICKKYNVNINKLNQVLKNMAMERKKNDGQYYTEQEVKEIIKNVKYKKGSMKMIGGELKIFW